MGLGDLSNKVMCQNAKKCQLHAKCQNISFNMYVNFEVTHEGYWKLLRNIFHGYFEDFPMTITCNVKFDLIRSELHCVKLFLWISFIVQLSNLQANVTASDTKIELSVCIMKKCEMCQSVVRSSGIHCQLVLTWINIHVNL